MFRRVALLLILAVIGSCSGDLPSSSVDHSYSERAFGLLRSSTPLVTLMRDRDIRPPDLSASDPLAQLQRELAKSDPSGTFAGITYDLTRGNGLLVDWLVQTPNRWGRKADDLTWFEMGCKDCEPDISLPACTSDADCRGGTCTAIWPRTPGARPATRKVCLGHSDALPVRIHDLVASARQSVDIVELQPAPTGRYTAALRAAIAELAFSRRRIEVRVLIGQFPPKGVDAADFLKELTETARDIPGSRVTVSVSAMRTCTVMESCNSFSWNHGKFIVVDGREAIVGGHNLWTEDYLTDNPVHDLSMQVRGPAAASASRFADRLWRFVCSNLGYKDSISLVSYSPGESEPGHRCPPALATPAPARGRPAVAAGGVEIMGIGRLGSGITDDFANQSELARDLMFGAARKTIRVSQQDLGFRLGRSDTLFPESALDEMIDLMERDGDVYVVLSNPGSIGNGGSPYYNDVPLQALAKRLKDNVQKRIHTADPRSRYAIRKGPDPVNALLCSRFHLAPFRFGPDDSWPGGKTIANHAKLWMVDDRIFYLGSDNMYPVNLQEFGFIVDDRQAADTLLDSYWNPLWQWSKRAAVSGAGVEKCIFRDIIK
jgi:phosphatidylserine/phosphatidylglycerophosphate/cardiolipin synthase-like enzyme